MRGLFFNAQPTTDIVAHPSGFDREYDSDDFNRYMGVFFGNGVFVRNDPDACKVTASGLRLDLTPGIALVDGGQCHFESGDGLTISQGDGLYSVMCRRNNAAAVRAFELVAIKGVEAYPAPVRDGDLYDLCLAHVLVEGGAATVTDKREDRELCGFAALTGQPPYYPPDEANLPYILWLYVLGLPMTLEQVEAVEGNPSLMEIFDQSRIVQAIKKASKEEAEEGTDNSKLMTPLRVADAVTKYGLVAKNQYGDQFSIVTSPTLVKGSGDVVPPFKAHYTEAVETENYTYQIDSSSGYAILRISKADGSTTRISGLASGYISGRPRLSAFEGDGVYILVKNSGGACIVHKVLPEQEIISYPIDSGMDMLVAIDASRFIVGGPHQTGGASTLTLHVNGAKSTRNYTTERSIDSLESKSFVKDGALYYPDHRDAGARRGLTKLVVPNDLSTNFIIEFLPFLIDQPSYANYASGGFIIAEWPYAYVNSNLRNMYDSTNLQSYIVCVNLQTFSMVGTPLILGAEHGWGFAAKVEDKIILKTLSASSGYIVTATPTGVSYGGTWSTGLGLSDISYQPKKIGGSYQNQAKMFRDNQIASGQYLFQVYPFLPASKLELNPDTAHNIARILYLDDTIALFTTTSDYLLRIKSTRDVLIVAAHKER